MSTADLGRIRTVPLQEVWAHEALHFTPWLLQNVDVLSDVLGMDLVLESAEHPVGTFSLDLIGHDESTGEIVIVENQLFGSDHRHLGQLITYAAGTGPSTIVWLAADFRPEHRAAIDWLNERTDEQTRFFAVTVRVVQIGDSIPAPSFQLAAAPNDWLKTVRASTTELTPGQQTFHDFWEATLTVIRAAHPDWTRSRATRASWVDLSTGVPGVVHSLVWIGGTLTCQLYFSSRDPQINLDRYHRLLEVADPLQAALGEAAEWDEMPGRKAARIVVRSDFTDIDDRHRWPDMAAWLMDRVERMRGALTAVGGVG